MKYIILTLLLISTLQSKHLHKEKVYQKIFCDKVKGKMEYVLKDRSRVDCYTSNYAFEVDFGSKGYEAIGQTLYYSIMTGKKPAIVLIRENRKDDKYIGRIKKVCKKHHIKLFVIDKYFEIRNIKLH